MECEVRARSILVLHLNPLGSPSKVLSIAHANITHQTHMATHEPFSSRGTFRSRASLLTKSYFACVRRAHDIGSMDAKEHTVTEGDLRTVTA